MATDTNERQAATIWVGISNYVGTAALAVLAAALALFTYLSQNFDVGVAFYIFISASAVLLVLSLAVGGWVSDEVASTVSKGTFPKSEWNGQAPGGFSVQTVLTLLGLIALLVAVAIGATSRKQASDTQRQLTELTRSVAKLDDAFKASEAHDAARISALSHRLAKLDRRVCRTPAPEARTRRRSDREPRPPLRRVASGRRC